MIRRWGWWRSCRAPSYVWNVLWRCNIMDTLHMSYLWRTIKYCQKKRFSSRKNYVKCLKERVVQCSEDDEQDTHTTNIGLLYNDLFDFRNVLISHSFTLLSYKRKRLNESKGRNWGDWLYLTTRRRYRKNQQIWNCRYSKQRCCIKNNSLIKQKNR